jgi:uncharacterized OB-fold protein
MADFKKQLPIITSRDRDFWEGAKRHELMAYNCLNCGSLYYPATHCVSCSNPKMEWVRVSGRGRVYTFIIYHQVYHPAWKGDIPYNVSWIKLDEGPLLLSNIVECKNEDIFIGMPVEVVFHDVTEEIALPKFKPGM